MDMDYYYDRNLLVSPTFDGDEGQRNKITKINLGKITKMANKDCHFTWTISDFYEHCFKSSPNICVQSPDFMTGDNNENVWYLQFAYGQNKRAHVKLYLKSCKNSLSNVKVQLSLINKSNKKDYSTEEELKFMKSGDYMNRFCNFIDIVSLVSKPWIFLPDGKLTIFCEIRSECLDKMKIIKNNKTDDLKRFLLSEKLSDVTLIVGDTEFHLHKAILASRSPVFLAMFENNMIENKENKIEVTDIDEEAMKVLILYIYTDEVENLDEMACIILPAADKYELEGLKIICEEVLSNILTNDNAFEILILADRYNTSNLKTNAICFIATHLNKMIDMPGFKLIKDKHSHLVDEILISVAKKS